MDEQKKYEVIKTLVDTQGSKDRAAFVHGNRGRKPAITTPDAVRKARSRLYRTEYYETNFTHFTELLERMRRSPFPHLP